MIDPWRSLLPLWRRRETQCASLEAMSGLRNPWCARIGALFAVGSLVLRTGLAHAQQPHPDSTAADVLFEEGRQAMARGDVAAACAKFDASRSLEPAVGTLLNLGECSQKLARKRVAWVAYREALRFMTPTDDRRALARERVAALESQLGRLALRLENGTPDTKVMVDGEPIGAPYDAVRLVEPGRHEVRVVAAGRHDALFAVTVEEAKTATLLVAPGSHASTVRSDGPEARGDRPGRRATGLVLGGTGVALLAGGAIFGVSALSSAAGARGRCGGGLACENTAALDASRADARTATTRATVSTVLLSAGAVATAVGLYLWITSGAPATRSASRAGARAASGLEL